MNKKHKKTKWSYDRRDNAIHLHANSKVLVTGGAGFLGFYICKQLLLDGKQVIIVDTFNDETSSSDEKIKNVEYLNRLSKKQKRVQFKWRKLDILNKDELTEFLRQEAPTSCIHAAALVMDRKSVQEPVRYIENNVLGTQYLLDAINQTGTVEHFVLISSRSAVGETSAIDDRMTENDQLRPINPYGASKAAAEAFCHAFHKNFVIPVSICRMQPLYGSRCRHDMMPRLLFESIFQNKAVEKYGSGLAVRDWLYVEDAALGVLAVLENPKAFSIFNFGTGIATTLNDLIQMVTEITGKSLNLINRDIPTGDAVFAGVCDNRKAKEILGWEPKVDLKTGLKIMYEYMKKNEYGSNVETARKYTVGLSPKQSVIRPTALRGKTENREEEKKVIVTG